MIVYICRKAHSYTLGGQLKFFPGSLNEKVRIVPYELLFSMGDLPAATYVFTDFDRLSKTEFDRVCRLWDWFDETGLTFPRLNDPRRALQRFDLLRELHTRGFNKFNVYRLHEWRDAKRFPVFIRHERGHSGIISDLITDFAALKAHVDRWSGTCHAHDLMIVEYCTQPFSDGRYRKFGAFRVDRSTYLQHCFITEGWYSKGVPKDLSAADKAEAERHRSTNPHSKALIEAFDIAAIDYGRADYTIFDGVVQIFEINTNPTVISLRSSSGVDSRKFSRLHEAQLIKLDSNANVTFRIPEYLAKDGRALSLDYAHAQSLRAVDRFRTMVNIKKLMPPGVASSMLPLWRWYDAR